MQLEVNNIFRELPVTLREEFLQTLAESGFVRVERIVSDGHASPPGEWYDQKQDEWVLLVSGEATLLFEKNATLLTMLPGDHVMIPAGFRHRVERTDMTQKTVWLAVHFK